MKKSVFLFTVLIASFFISNVYAEQSLQYIVTVSEGNSSITQDEANEYIDSSNVNVKVVKYDNNTENVIYRGKLGNYDNGLWNYTDFNKMQFLVIFDWYNMDEEPIYIIPESNLSTVNMSRETLMNLDEEQGVVENNLSFIYNDKYYEKQLISDNQIKAETIVKNTKNIAENISVFVAAYDNNNKLTDISTNSAVINNTGEYSVVYSTLNIPSTQNGYLKAYIWNGQNLQPYELPQMIISTKDDYYSNDFENAVLIDENREVIGSIDTPSDIDFLKFIANKTGEYVLNINSENSATCNVYSAKEQLLATFVNGIINANLTIGNEYYIKVSGNQVEDYSVNVLSMSNRELLSRDTLVSGSMSAAEIKTYEFTPTDNSTYVFTAIGPKNIKARLFDTAYSLIDEDSSGDENTAFRVSGDLIAEQKYYLTIISDWNLIGTANYTESTEVPMELISIE